MRKALIPDDEQQPGHDLPADPIGLGFLSQGDPSAFSAFTSPNVDDTYGDALPPSLPPSEDRDRVTEHMVDSFLLQRKYFEPLASVCLALKTSIGRLGSNGKFIKYNARTWSTILKIKEDIAFALALAPLLDYVSVSAVESDAFSKVRRLYARVVEIIAQMKTDASLANFNVLTQLNDELGHLLARRGDIENLHVVRRVLVVTVFLSKVRDTCDAIVQRIVSAIQSTLLVEGDHDDLARMVLNWVAPLANGDLHDCFENDEAHCRAHDVPVPMLRHGDTDYCAVCVYSSSAEKHFTDVFPLSDDELMKILSKDVADAALYQVAELRTALEAAVSKLTKDFTFL